MKNIHLKVITFSLLLFYAFGFAQANDSMQEKQLLQDILAIERQQVLDSIKKSQLQEKLNSLNNAEGLQQNGLKNNLASQNSKLDSLRNTTQGFPVIRAGKDTLFLVYTKNGALMASERALAVSQKIDEISKDDSFQTSSLQVAFSEGSYDIMYGDTILMNVSQYDTLWYQKTHEELAQYFKTSIEDAILKNRSGGTLSKILMRVGLAIMVIGIAWFLIWLIGKGYRKLLLTIHKSKEKWLRNLSYKDYTFLSAEQELHVVLFS